MSGGKIALLVIGIILLVGALVLIAGGSGLMWLSQTLENDNALFTPRTIRLKADSYAIMSEPFSIDWYDESQGDWWVLHDLVPVTVEGESNDLTKGIFMGIARETDVDTYLSSVRHHETTEWNTDPFDDPEVLYQPHAGESVPSDPTTQTFWEVSVHGDGKKTLEWQPEMGKWVLVIMNQDGSAGIDVDATLGAELPWLFWLGLGLLCAGVVVLVGGIVMIYFAARRPKGPVTQAPALGTGS